MDFRSPNAFCALAITVFASCAMALPHRNARQIAATASFFNTASPLYQRRVAGYNAPVPDILYPLGLPWARDSAAARPHPKASTLKMTISISSVISSWRNVTFQRELRGRGSLRSFAVKPIKPARVVNRNSG